MQLERWLEIYWPYLFFIGSLVISLVAAIHITLNKRDVRAAIGWVGVVMLSPLLGSLLYVIAGINRIRVRRLSQERDAIHPDAYPEMQPSELDVAQVFGPSQASQKILGDRVSEFPLLDGNRVDILPDGDTAYAAMLQAIREAQHSVLLQSYIFDHDGVGQAFAEALIQAHQRGIQVRVLVDAVGESYSRPAIGRLLLHHGVPYARFRLGVFGLRLAYANLRSHRKLLIVDGRIGFTGGMNIRQGFSFMHSGEAASHDTHFRFEGPLVLQLTHCFVLDWEFTTGECLCGPEWFPRVPTPGYVPARCVPSGPDQSMGNTHSMLLGALAAAQHRVMIQTPYFLPDAVLIGALATAARRGVTVDIVIPARNNLRLVDYAMTAQLDLVVRSGCRVWRHEGAFDHSKLMTVDGVWSYVGSSNLDPRSLRLNFELDVEIYDRNTATWLEQRIQRQINTACLQTLENLQALPLLVRLRNGVVWLASPYL